MGSKGVKNSYKVGTKFIKGYLARLYTAKPCPFCGCTKLYFADGMDLNEENVFWLYCSKCNCAGPQAVLQTDAVEAWNARKDEEGGPDLRYRVWRRPLPKDDDRAVPQYMLHPDHSLVTTHRIPPRLRANKNIPKELQLPYFQGVQYNERDPGLRAEKLKKDGRYNNERLRVGLDAEEEDSQGSSESEE